MENSDKKKHADFQSDYRRSSNFINSVKDEEFEIEGDGELKIDKDKKGKMIDIKDKEKIADAMDVLEKRTETKLGGKQKDKK